MTPTGTDPTARDPEPQARPELAERIRSALVPGDPLAARYLDLGARLDRVSAVEVGHAAVAWRSLHATWDRPWIIAMGSDGAQVARCVARLAERTGPAEGITVAREAFGHLPGPVRPVEHWEWDWWWTSEQPPVRPDELRVVDLLPDDPRIPAVLDVASPDAMVRPGDRRILAWAGIEAGAAGPPDPAAGEVLPDAALVAVAALTTMRPGIPHLGSVATREGWRGRGLARDLCGRMTRGALAGGAPAVTLGMHAANRSARAVYTSLGFQLGYRWASGTLARPRPS